MWIETSISSVCVRAAGEFIRQQWRMWIETRSRRSVKPRTTNSFASNGECGLKLGIVMQPLNRAENSFASNGECGLKRTGNG